MGRDEAIAQLAAETFLPIDKASCVVDAVFMNTGVYNPKSEAALASVDQSELVAACTEVDDDFVLPERDENAPLVEVEELAVETGAIEIVERFELTEATMPSLAPAGGIASGSVTLDGKTIDYVTITPPGFTIGESAPVFLALPPGNQGQEMVTDVASSLYLVPAVAQGWVVVSPASPGGVWHDDDNTAVIPEFVRWINAWAPMEGGKPHLGGMSNGGISAFHIALQDPTQFHSLVAYPGVPESQADQDKLTTLADIPIHLWVGAEDSSWLVPMEAAAVDLRLVGGSVELNIVPGEGHVIQARANLGVQIFDALNAAR